MNDESTPPKLIPYATTFQAPEGFEIAALYQVARSKDSRFFVNAPFDKPALVLLLQAQGCFLANRKIAEYFKDPKEASRIWTPNSMQGKA